MAVKVYDNRELSWLKFNKRVLEEAGDSSVPLMERLKFTGIFSSNLDEFFMVRVGSLIDKKNEDDSERDGKTKMRPSEQLDAIYNRVEKLIALKDKTVNAVNKELELHGFYKKSLKSLNREDKEYLDCYFAYELQPFLTAFIIDKRHPFPFLNNKELYIACRLASKSDVKLGIICCSEKFKRLVFLPTNDGTVSYIPVEEIISRYAHTAFESYSIEEKAVIRITRNADIDLEESYDDELDFRENMSNLIRSRKRLRPVRLQISKEVSSLMLDSLLSRLELSKKQCFVEKTPLDMSYVYTVSGKAADKKELFYRPAEPQPSRMVNPREPMMPQIDRGDIFLSYPYESIKPFIRLLEEAAKDEAVTSIKMTLYRLAKNSKIIKALCAAAENGKEVIILVELRARFDEENNIEWSKLLEESGCRILYGPQGYKVHSKLCLITKQIDGEAKHYTQVGTGNYNEKTAELYTDFCLMTSNESFATDAENIFSRLSVGEPVDDAKTLLVAPNCLQNRVLDMMDDEIAIARAGGKGYVGAKLNALTDKMIIDKLIECSQAGVKVDLVIRGISCLVAGIDGVTDNIRIISIVGRYLEHARIYIFGSGVRKRVYISSADYMTRNTRRRVEVAAPVLNDGIKQRIIGYFDIQMSDNVKAREQQPDGKYRRVPTGETAIAAQKHFTEEAYANAPKPQAEEAIPVASVAKEPAAPTASDTKPEAPTTETPPVPKAAPTPTPLPVQEEKPKKLGFFARLKAFFRGKRATGSKNN